MPFSDGYSGLDRLLHRLAFGMPVLQKALAELEDDLFARELRAVESQDEVFVTGLPRAGTTLLLEILHGTGEFATYTYRNMPFVLAPLAWHRLSHRFHEQGRRRERAHADGMQISYDSPEAFEEVVWLAHMANRIVRGDRLAPVHAGEVPPDAAAAIRRSVRKILALGRTVRQDPGHLRYLSKNNANISRIDALLEMFPSARVLVLFRNPQAQVQSLARQHERFLQAHAEDAFARDYMKWIGHHDFGLNFKPIDFDGWLAGANAPWRVDPAFWVRYWTAAYTYALARQSRRVLFVDFDGLLEGGAAALARIGAAVGIRRSEALATMAQDLRAPTTRPDSGAVHTGEAWDRAREVHALLQAAAV